MTALEDVQALHLRLTAQARTAEQTKPSAPPSSVSPRSDPLAILTWEGGHTEAVVVSTKRYGAWLRIVGCQSVPPVVTLCPGLGGEPSTTLVVHSRFEFTSETLLELRLEPRDRVKPSRG